MSREVLRIGSFNTRKGRALLASPEPKGVGDESSGIVSLLGEVDIAFFSEITPGYTGTLERILGLAGLKAVSFDGGSTWGSSTRTPGGLAVAVRLDSGVATSEGGAWCVSAVRESSSLNDVDPPLYYPSRSGIHRRDGAFVEVDWGGLMLLASTSHPFPPFGPPGVVMWDESVKRVAREASEASGGRSVVYAGDTNAFGRAMRRRFLGAFREVGLDVDMYVPGVNTYKHSVGWRGRPDLAVVDRNLGVVGMRVVQLAGSDHGAIIFGIEKAGILK